MELKYIEKDSKISKQIIYNQRYKIERLNFIPQKIPYFD